MNSKILIVDDEDDLRRLIGKLLESRDYEVSTAADGTDALDMIFLEKFDLYILDVFMPNMNGLELMKKIKEIDPMAVIVITTAFSSVEVAMSAVRGGAFHFLTKPIVAEELFRVVETGLRQHKDMLKNMQKSASGLIEESDDFFASQMLRGFSSEDKAEFQNIAEVHDYEQGNEIPLTDEPGSIILVENGDLSVWLSETEVDRLHAGDSWGEETFVASSFLFTGLKAESETRIQHYSRKKIIEFFTYKDESLTKRFTINLMNILYLKWKKAMVKIGSFAGYENNRIQ